MEVEAGWKAGLCLGGGHLSAALAVLAAAGVGHLLAAPAALAAVGAGVGAAPGAAAALAAGVAGTARAGTTHEAEARVQEGTGVAVWLVGLPL